MENNYSLVELVKMAIKWKKPLIIVIVLGAIGSVIVSLLLPNYYESKTLFYPTNPSLTDRQILFSTESKENYVDYFGGKKDNDRIMTIARSEGLASYIIDKFDLYTHYDIDIHKDRFPRTKVLKEFHDNYKVEKTELGAIEVSVMDKDPKFAAQLCNGIVNRIDEINKQMLMKNKKDVVDVFKSKVDDKQKEVQFLTDSLARLSDRYNIRQITYIDGENHYYTGTSTEGIEIFKVLQKIHENALMELNTLNLLYNQYQLSIQSKASSLQIVQSAEPAEQKSRPIRWLICLLGTAGVTFFALIAIAITEKINQFKQSL